MELLMNIKEKLENYFIELGIPFENKGENLWVITDDAKNLQKMLVSIEGTVITLTQNLMTIPEKNRENFYKTLLTLNTRDLIHGAYGIEGNNIVWIDTLESETLDLGELRASIEALSMSVTEHYKVLSDYRTK
jgi:hypothetical protein